MKGRHKVWFHTTEHLASVSWSRYSRLTGLAYRFRGPNFPLTKPIGTRQNTYEGEENSRNRRLCGEVKWYFVLGLCLWGHHWVVCSNPTAWQTGSSPSEGPCLLSWTSVCGHAPDSRSNPRPPSHVDSVTFMTEISTLTYRINGRSHICKHHYI